MILDIETFELWMSKIMERFDRHERMLCTLTGKEVKELMAILGEAALSPTDLLYARFADEFEKRYVSRATRKTVLFLRRWTWAGTCSPSCPRVSSSASSRNILKNTSRRRRGKQCQPSISTPPAWS